jgi:DNA-binding IclR family transcriptional regulator
MTDYTIAAVDEAFAVLLLVAQNPGLGVTELSHRSGNTKARTFRLLYTLEQRNFVARRGSGPTYYLDVQSLYIGVAAQEQIDLVRTARQHLLALGRTCNENVQLRVRDGMECVCVDHWQSLHPAKTKSGAGSRRRLHAGASCKLLLAFAPQDVRHALLGADLPRYTPSTITQRSRLIQELNRIRTDGYAISHGEITEGVIALAAPVHDVDGEVIAALSLAGPEERIFPGQQKYLDLLSQHAAQITADLKTA